MRQTVVAALGLAAALLLLAGSAARAADPAPEGAPGRPTAEAEVRSATEAAMKVLQRGPREIKLGDQAALQLPERYGFIPAAEGGRVMRAMGNSVGTGFQGLVLPLTDEDSSSFFILTYEPSGYIKDDDAKDWKADDLLQQMREGTEEGNKRRAQLGIPAIEVTGWIEAPHYQADKHQLVWSIGSREKDAPAGQVEGVNYRTLVLGREGYMAMTLVTDRDHVAALRPGTALLLDRLTFGQGKRYADFNSSTDHVAEFGLAALVAGVAAKKLGLLALAIAFVVKFAKILLLAVAGVGLALRKKLGLAKKAEPAVTPAAAPAAPAAAAAPGQQAEPPGAPPAPPTPPTPPA